MSDTLITIIAILLAAVLMFIFPLLSVSERSDDISQLSVAAATTEFVDNARATGKITMDEYTKLVSTINATGNSYDIEMEVKVLDENVGKKSAWTQGTVIGENVYYSVYTAQIVEVLQDEGNVYNINADTAAGEVASSVGAEKLIILTDVPGVLRDPSDPSTLIQKIRISEIPQLIEEGIISGGMIPKIETCVKAIENGVKSCHIIDGRKEHAMLYEIFTTNGIGTMIFE